MTLLGARDGEDRDYADIAEALPDHGARVNDDLAELYRRVVFGVVVHNTDDHLRNHGFLRSPGGWRISPLFDVNPDPDPGKARAAGISGAVSIDDEPDGMLALAGYCRLSRDQALHAVDQVCGAVRLWRQAAARNGIGKAEQDQFADVLDGQLATLNALSR
jgi:serine/threonine-protein kinase HipA